MKTSSKLDQSFHHDENLSSLTLQTKGAAEATPFPYRPERFRSHRFLHQATTTELITPPTILNTPVTKSSATCERKALNPSVKNIPVKKYTLIIPSNNDCPMPHSRSSRLRNNTPSR